MLHQPAISLPKCESKLQPPIAIICGASATGLGVARDLGREGVPVMLADTEADRPAFGSRYCNTHQQSLVAPTAEELWPRVIEFARKQDHSPVLIATSDVFASSVAEHYEKLSQHVQIVGCHPNVDLFVNKERFYEFCVAANVPVPQTAFPKTRNDLLDATRDFDFPIILKPIIGHLWRERLHGKKLLVANSQADVAKISARFGDDVEGLMVQQMIPGRDENIWIAGLYADQQSKIQQCFVGRKLRQFPVGFGSATLAKGEFCQEVERLSRIIIERSRFHGICGTEFKFDPRDQTYKAIEVNPRPTLWFSLIRQSGVAVNYHAYCEAARIPAPHSSPQIDGRKWLMFEKDLISSAI